VPADAFPFPVLIRGEVQFVGGLQFRLEAGDDLLLARDGDVVRCEVVLQVDAVVGPRLVLDGGRDVRFRRRQVPDVADAGIDDVALGQVLLDLLRLGRRLDDDQLLAGGGGVGHWGGAPTTGVAQKAIVGSREPSSPYGGC
jgi:hypothetical protein